jgi:hypothetical protein
VLNEKLPVDIWARGNDFAVTIPGPGHVVGVTLDPEAKLPDIDRANNRWVKAGGGAGQP